MLLSLIFLNSWFYFLIWVKLNNKSIVLLFWIVLLSYLIVKNIIISNKGRATVTKTMSLIDRTLFALLKVFYGIVCKINIF
jgi:hypothetical protein